MLFSSQAFILLFLPLTLAAYYAVAGSRAWRLNLLLVASFVFYAYWDPRFVPLLGGSILANWLIARCFHRRSLSLLAAFGLAFNLGLLAVFKYADFFAGNLLALFGKTHEAWSLVLPLGISFFTFQQISYLVDLKRGSAPVYSLREYAAYVAFFPQLIAGPIVRHNELIPQFDLSPLRDGIHERLSRGAVLFVLGLLKKVYLADEYAPLVDRHMEAAALGTFLSGIESWYTALAYSLQLYFDFSAYSDMAIGLGLMFGLKLPLNFNIPYRAQNIRVFWQRWHMSLSSFLRDYVYIPLGGSRQGAMGTSVAVMVTMLLCGLWHGAGWTFVAWGCAHGVAILVSRAWAATGVNMPASLAWSLTMVFVIAGWVLFRAEDFHLAGELLASMAGLRGWAWGTIDGEDLRFLVFGCLLATLGPHNAAVAEQSWIARRVVAAIAGVALVAVILRVGAGRSLEFIYFQF